MLQGGDLGAELYKSWSKAQRREEIARLVEGYRNGLSIGVLCNMVTLIAGSKKQARRHLAEMLKPEEKRQALDGAVGGMRQIVEEYLS